MAFVTKMDCSFFKISRVTCLQEMQVFGQEDAPGLYGKQSKAGLFFSLKITFKGEYLFFLLISHLKALYVLGKSVQACFVCVSTPICFPPSL